MRKTIKKSKLNLSFNLINRFDGNLRYLYDGSTKTCEELISFMESFASLKRVSNPGDKWHAYMKEGQFTLCESKFALNLTFDGWTEIGNIDL